MDKYNTEIFGEFTYAERLTYEELLEREKFLLENLDGIYQGGGADHIDFTPQGDILMMQCAFESKNLEILHDIADEIASILPDGVRGRILCLEKNLTSYHLFWLKRGEWREKIHTVPKEGPAEAPLHKVEIFVPEPDSENIGEVEAAKSPMDALRAVAVSSGTKTGDDSHNER